jgi:hypothetical protein
MIKFDCFKHITACPSEQLIMQDKVFPLTWMPWKIQTSRRMPSASPHTKRQSLWSQS